MAGGGANGQGGVFGMLRGINQAESIGNPGSPGFISPSQLGQQASYQPGFAAQQMSPLNQQLMQRSMAPQPITGLPAALMQMRGQLNQPMMRAPMPMYQNPALAYRPNMALAQQRLNNVAKSVILQQKEAAEAELARMKEAEEARQMQQQQVDYGSVGG